ncbi:hypothetical protein Tco_1311486 [Tanacetum coccineum]
MRMTRFRAKIYVMRKQLEWRSLTNSNLFRCLRNKRMVTWVADYVLKMKGYVEKLERLGYYEKCLPKKAETPQVMMIRDGKIQKANKKSLKAKGKNKVNGKGKDKKDWHKKRTAIFCNTQSQYGSPTKKGDKTPKERGWKSSKLVLLKVWDVRLLYAEIFEKRLISQEIKWEAVDLKKIQEEEYTTPSKITSNIPQEVEGFEPPQEEVIPIRRSERTHRAPNRLCLNVEVEEHSLGDLNEPTSYKAAMLDSESNKWIDANEAEYNPLKDNMYGSCSTSSVMTPSPSDRICFRFEWRRSGLEELQARTTSKFQLQNTEIQAASELPWSCLDQEVYLRAWIIVPSKNEPLNIVLLQSSSKSL